MIKVNRRNLQFENVKIYTQQLRSTFTYRFNLTTNMEIWEVANQSPISTLFKKN